MKPDLRRLIIALLTTALVATVNAQTVGATSGQTRTEPAYRRYDAGAFQLDIPESWRQVRGTHGLAFAAGQAQGGGLTIGVDLGMIAGGRADLQSDTNALIAFIRLANPNLKEIGVKRSVLAGRQGLETTLSNVSALTGESEVIRLTTIRSTESDLFFIATIAPSSVASNYVSTFEHIVRSVEFVK